MSAFDYSATYYKFIGDPSKHCSRFPYKIGLNRLLDNNGEKFNPKSLCGPGGLYFTNASYIWAYIEYGNTMCTIRVPPEAQVVHVGNKYKCDQFVIESMEELGLEVVKKILKEERLKDAASISCYLLPWACRNNDTDVVLYLVSNGLCAWISALNEASYLDNQQLVLCLLKYEKLESGDGAPPSRYDGALEMSIRRNHLEVASLLIEYGADVNRGSYYEFGEGPLLTAIDRGNPVMVQLLIEAGADVRVKEDAALILASKQGKSEIVQLLLNAGAKCTSDMRAIFAAFHRSYSDIVELLLAADDEIRLVWASCMGQADVVQDLLEQKVDVHSRDDAALIWAAKKGRLEVVELLIEAGADVNAQDGEPLKGSIVSDNIQILQLLISSGASVNSADTCPLLSATRNCKIKMVQFLIEAGADQRSKDAALCSAIICGYMGITRLLLEAGADPHTCDNYALRWAPSFVREKVEALIKETKERV